MKKSLYVSINILFILSLSLVINSNMYAGKSKTEKMKVTGIEGRKCLDIIKTEVKKINGVKSINFSKTNFKDKTTNITIIYSGESCEPIKKAISEKGYNVECISCKKKKDCSESDCDKCPEHNK